jgi:hypothetical protein
VPIEPLPALLEPPALEFEPALPLPEPALPTLGV